MTFYEVLEDIRIKKGLRVNELLTRAGIQPQIRYYWKDTPSASPSLPLLKRIEDGLNIKFIIGEGGIITGWKNDFGVETPASVGEVVRLPLDGTYRELFEQLRRMLDDVRGSMDADEHERRKLEAAFSSILLEMELVRDSAENELRTMFKRAKHLIDNYQLLQGTESETENDGGSFN